MRRLWLIAVAACACVACAAPVHETGVVARIGDGDSLSLRNGARIRLHQIDAPELGSGECYGRAALAALAALLPPGTRIVLESDPALDAVDRHGRRLRYVFSSSVNVNVELVRRGAAVPYFFRGERGRYARLLQEAAAEARAARRGLWGACY